jgi:hypothetical protein
MIGSIAGYHDSSGAFKITNRYSCRYWRWIEVRRQMQEMEEKAEDNSQEQGKESTMQSHYELEVLSYDDSLGPCESFISAYNWILQFSSR